MTFKRSEPANAGRKREQHRIRRMLEAAGRGMAWAFVAGEPGIGKTWLINEMAEEAAGRGFMVIGGRGTEFEQHVPFGLLVHAMDDYLESLDPQRLHGLGGDRLGDLARVFPALARYDTAGSGVLQDAAYRANRAIRALLERLADPQGIVLVLDDLHWADQESIAFLAHVLDRPVKGRLLVLGAWRTGPHDDALERLSMKSELPGVTVRLGPLDEAEAAPLLATVRGPQRRTELLRQSGGNPLYLNELARAGDRGDLDTVPTGILAVLRQELSRLGDDAREVLLTASVVGDPFDLRAVQAAADLRDEVTVAAADELVAAGLIRETAVPRRFAFQRPVVGRGVYQIVPPGRRITVHRRMAGQLAGAPATLRAPHLAKCAAPPDPSAAVVLAAAGREALEEQPVQAVDWFRAARVLTADDPPAHAEALVGYGDATARIGRLREAVAAYDDALAHMADHKPEQRLPVLRHLAVVGLLTGDAVSGRDRLRSELARIDGADPGPPSMLWALAAGAALQVHDFAGLRECAGRSLAYATELGDPAPLALAHALVGLGELSARCVGHARVTRNAARTALASASDAEVLALPEAALATALLELFIGRYAEVATVLDRLPADAWHTDRNWWRGPAQLLAAQADFALGRLAAATDAAEAAVELARLGDARPLLVRALALQAALLVVAGDDNGAAGLVSEAVQAAGGDPVLLATTDQALGGIRFDIGELQLTVEMVRRLHRRAPSVDPTAVCGWHYRLVRAALDEGRLDVADEALHATERAAAADATGLPRAAAYAARARAAVHLARRQAREAVTAAGEAAEASAAAGVPIDAARDRLVEASALVLAGDREPAAAALRAALEEFRRCGAKRYEEEAGRELRRLGRRTSSGPVEVSDGAPLPLSEREWQIAELVAAGRTNRQIASTLLLSGKTVETHLTRIFSKLGISSRTLLARAVERERITRTAAPAAGLLRPSRGVTPNRARTPRAG
jgi:DNA-binding NarL/FixJ family response regulator